MSSLRGMRRLLRRQGAAPPFEEPEIPRIAADPERPPLAFDREAGDLWQARLLTVLFDHYAGVPLYKFPEDLRVYEHLLWAGRVDTVIELGSAAGGSALWFSDRLRTFREHGRCAGSTVISVDIDITDARANAGDRRGIRLLEGDILDPELPERVAAELPRDARCLVVEDGPHTYEATSAALAGFSRFVPVGGWFVVEDGVVDEDELRIGDDWPRGVQRAVNTWLASPAGTGFELRRDFEAYGITTNPGGYLRRTS
jgi:cephalosporin hydroxylase